jgi:murein DD-endopeptidase MepM/ murein hydrolase activator NlpD
VDLSYATGTNVYAVADGVVRQIREDIDDDTHPPDCDDWGNFVLIRHNQKHWDRTTQLWAYVYSLYAHLQHDSVRVEQGNSVTAGHWIADVDKTGQ